MTPRRHALARLIAVTIALGSGCNRGEEPQPSAPEPTRAVGQSARSAAAANATVGQSARSAAAANATIGNEPPHATSGTKRAGAGPKGCVIPLADLPPPPERPATTCPADPTGRLELTRQFITFVEAPGAPRINVEQARSESERERGLMFRTSLASDEGMLFYFDDDSVRTFWMHNTCIPLDMLFITADGLISGILEQVPVLNDAGRSIPCPVRYVLEVSAGWTRAHGVRPGQRLRIES